MLEDGDFGQLSSAQHEAVAEVESKSEDLLALIEDILEVARIEEAGMTLVPSVIEPRSFLEELLAEWTHRFQQEGTHAELEVDADLPTLEADRALLKRVFANLIQNAITHSAQPINLRLRARKQADRILFAVQDDGPGIPPEYHDIIFRKFGQAYSPNAPRVRSSGLGLTFCKLVVDLHDGRIWVKSNVDEGSTFYIELPQRHASAVEASVGGQPKLAAVAQ
jgi:signal transduction histidine kinase